MRYILAVLILLPSLAFSRPVSYADGWMVMQDNDFMNNSLEFSYSPKFDYSIGAKIEHDRETDIEAYMLRFNYLLKRWNMEGAQANVFFKSGAGAADDSGDLNAGYDVSLQGDYETRRIYTYYEAGYDDYGDMDKFWQKARIGVAPYVTGYDGLHTWVMLQVDHSPENESEVVYTPYIRMFYDSYLWEVGYSSEKTLLLNWEVTF